VARPSIGLEEVLAMAKNAHPHLVECCEQGIEQDADGQFVVRIIMEFCDRGDLQAAIARGTPFGAARVLSWTQQVLSALHFLHERNIAHRDVKPGNILLCGAEEVAKLGDLGLASSRDAGSTRSVAGTIAFMAPEMFSGTYGVQASPLPTRLHNVMHCCRKPDPGACYSTPAPTSSDFSACL
jgi:serine/threonine protein kinase